ncbi:hypothetical protein P0F40_002901 [Vibrio metschnikovii]|nr:hypothetical protein [Vibrio metschnikovii]
MADLNNHASKSNPAFRDQTSTPEWLFQAFNSEFSFDLDAAATKESAKCSLYFTPETDGLTQDWESATMHIEGATVWVNPPYSDIGPWMQKAKEEQAKGITTCLLVPHDNRAEWWPISIASEIRDIVGYYDERVYLSGKQKGQTYQKWCSGGIRFVDASTGKEMPHELNKPVCLVVFRPGHVGPCQQTYISKRELLDVGRAIVNTMGRTLCELEEHSADFTEWIRACAAAVALFGPKRHYPTAEGKMALMAAMGGQELKEHTAGLSEKQKQNAETFCFAVSTYHVDELKHTLTLPQFVTVIQQLKTVNDNGEHNGRKIMTKRDLRKAFIDLLNQINQEETQEAA